MGRPYLREMENVRQTYEWTRTVAIDDLAGFIKKHACRPMYAVGSGGSFTAATFASALHQRGGTISECMTPLEFVSCPKLDRRASAMLITAGGNNKDILAAFERAVASEMAGVCIVCASTGNRLIRAASGARNVAIHASTPPAGKDGFLATNSLASTMVWLARAYSDTCFPYEMPRFDRLGSCDDGVIARLRDAKTAVVLYDYWGKAAAVDVESKMVEAGLANVQASDYRNFGHGRHNWLDKSDQTCVVALITPNSRRLASATLDLIPQRTPTVRLSTCFDGPVAAVDLTLQAFRLVGFFGTARGIDPGRPRVKNFGRKLYSLGMPRNPTYAPSDFGGLAMQRKFGSAEERATVKSRQRSLNRFVDRMSRQKFGAVVFDYDGTLCDDSSRHCGPTKKTASLLSRLIKSGVVVGVATGRGDSVRADLTAVLPKKQHASVLVGYHNCSEIGNLADPRVPDPRLPVDEQLHATFELIKSRIHPRNVSSTPRQISIRSPNPSARYFAGLARDLGVGRKIKVVESSHSVDLLPPSVSKISLYNLIRERLPSDLAILCIGDRGRWPGNDYELLGTEHSLSVDEASEDPTRCWNLLSHGTHGEAGVLEYFGMFDIGDGFIQATRSALHKNTGGRAGPA